MPQSIGPSGNFQTGREYCSKLCANAGTSKATDRRGKYHLLIRGGLSHAQVRRASGLVLANEPPGTRSPYYQRPILDCNSEWVENARFQHHRAGVTPSVSRIAACCGVLIDTSMEVPDSTVQKSPAR